MKLELIRANANSSFGKKYRNHALAIDIHGCYLFLVKHKKHNSPYYNPKFVDVINFERPVYKDVSIENNVLRPRKTALETLTTVSKYWEDIKGL